MPALSDERKPNFRILEVNRKGSSENEVIIKYYNTKTKEIFEKEDKFYRITPSIEVLYQKYGFKSANELIDILTEQYPKGEFKVIPYTEKKSKEEKDSETEELSGLDQNEVLKKALAQTKKDNQDDDWADAELYMSPQNSVIIQHIGNFDDHKDLEFFIDEKKKKQIFIKNSDKRYKVRTQLLKSDDFDLIYNELETRILPENARIDDETGSPIKIKKNYLESIVTSEQLKELSDIKELRIFEYDSKSFTKEKDAEILLSEIKEFPEYKIFAERARVVIDRSEKDKPKYKVRLNAAKTNSLFEKQLKEKSFKPHFENKTHQISTAELKWDPLGENNLSEQLRWHFPIHSSYEPLLSLKAQVNTNPKTFSYDIKKDILEPPQTLELKELNFWKRLSRQITHSLKNISRQKKIAFVPYEAVKIEPKERKVSRIHKSELEQAVDDGYDFYKNNYASIDLETIDWIKGEIPSGRVYMAVLRSEKENNIYVTKEFWRSEEFKETFEKKYKDTGKIIFVDDEIDLIGTLAKDAEKYEYITGHNYLGYDKVHLKKFDNNKEVKESLSNEQKDKIKNYSNELSFNRIIRKAADKNIISSDEQELITKFKDQQGYNRLWHSLYKNNTLTKDQKSKIDEIAKTEKTTNLWDKKDDKALDTLKYLQNRMDLLHDQKLATYAGFKKSIDYDEMARYVKEGNLEGLMKVIDYTFIDGDKSKELTEKLLYNAVLEQTVTNKPISTIFNSEPKKQFYDSLGRGYFMKKGTFRNRHDMKFQKHFDKLEDRMSPEDIFYEMVKSFQQKIGVLKEQKELYYPSIFIESCKEIIDNQPALSMIYDKAQIEKDPVLKADLLSKLSNAILVPLDKVRNYIEDAGLKFGHKYSPEEIYKFMNTKDEEEAANLFAENDQFELSRRSWIFGIEYGISRKKSTHMNLPVELTMLEINNKVADYFDEFRKKPYDGITKKYYFGNDLTGYKLGDLTNVINFKKERAIGILTHDNNRMEFYGNMKKPKNENVKKVLFGAMYDNKEISFKEYDSLIENNPDMSKGDRNIIKTISDIPIKTKKRNVKDIGQDSLF